MKAHSLDVKRLRKKDLIVLLDQLEVENQALQTKIAQLENEINHPDLSHLPKGSNQELLSELAQILNK